MTSSSHASLLILKTSLNPGSRSCILAKEALRIAKEQGVEVELVDLLETPLPSANGHANSAYDDPNVKKIHDKIAKASALIVATPIYSYSVSSVTKNLFELTQHSHKTILSGKAWTKKVVGILAASGSPRSMMAPLSFMNMLILDAKALLAPSFTITSGEDYQGDELTPAALKRVEETVLETITLMKKMAA